jgi:hypothetical protein
MRPGCGMKSSASANRTTRTDAGAVRPDRGVLRAGLTVRTDVSGGEGLATPLWKPKFLNLDIAGTVEPLPDGLNPIMRVQEA